MVAVEQLLDEARRLDLASTEGRFRLSDLTEAIRHEFGNIVDLHDRLTTDLQINRDTITETWFVASALPPVTRRPGQPWVVYMILRFHPDRHELIDRAAREGWDQARLEHELAAWFASHQHRRPEPPP